MSTKRTTHNLGCGFKGRVKVAVLDHLGRVVTERPWQKNLWLDQGMNRLAVKTFAECFEWAAAGTGTTATKEIVDTANSYTLSGTTLTRSAGTRDFTVDDVGKLARQTDAPFTEAIIDGFTSATVVSVRAVGQTSLANYTAKDIILYSVHQVALVSEAGDRTNDYSAVTGDNGTTDVSNARTLKRTFLFPAVTEQLEAVAVDLFSRSGTTVTRDSGTRDFTPTDVGKYIYFTTTEELTKITVYTSATQVTVADSGTVASQEINLYGFIAYGEVGFSDSDTPADNLNVRVRFEDGGGNSDPVVVEGETPDAPGQQLRVTYEVEITAEPSASTPGSALISDPGSLLSSNKNGDYVIEHLALSAIDNDGGTNADYQTLEPAEPGSAGWSPVTTVLDPLDGPDRSAGSVGIELEADTYVADSFTLTYEGIFGINDAIATNWRCLGLYDPTSETFPFVFRFDVAQNKSAEIAVAVRFRKTWNRDLS